MYSFCCYCLVLLFTPDHKIPRKGPRKRHMRNISGAVIAEGLGPFQVLEPCGPFKKIGQRALGMVERLGK